MCKFITKVFLETNNKISHCLQIQQIQLQPYNLLILEYPRNFKQQHNHLDPIIDYDVV